MIAVLGILGCIWIAAAVVVGTVAGTIIGVEQMESAEESADEMQQLQREANEKSEARQKMMEATNDAVNTRNLNRTREQVSGAIAYERLLTQRTRHKNAEKRQELAEVKSSNYNYGKPQTT